MVVTAVVVTVVVVMAVVATSVVVVTLAAVTLAAVTLAAVTLAAVTLAAVTLADVDTLEVDTSEVDTSEVDTSVVATSGAVALKDATNLAVAANLPAAAASTATPSARGERGIALPRMAEPAAGVVVGAVGVVVGVVGAVGSAQSFGRFFWETSSRMRSGRIRTTTRSGLMAPHSTTTMVPMFQLTPITAMATCRTFTAMLVLADMPAARSESPPDVTQSCGAFAPGVTSFPIEPIRQAIHPTGDQITLLKDLADASSKASAILSASCPSEPPLTPIARLDAVERRLKVTIQAIEIVRPALANLYNSLSDEQRQRLDAIGADEPRHERKTAVTGSSGAATLVSLCGDQAASFTRLPFQRIEEIVKPTGQQQSALEKLQQASQQAAGDLRASCPTRTPETPVARLDATNSRLAAMVQAVETIRPELGSFYASLNDEQKAQFNTMGQQNRIGRPG